MGLFDTRTWVEFADVTGALVSHFAMCQFRDGSQKLTSALMSRNLAHLKIALDRKQCPHPIGSHPPAEPVRAPDGSFSTAKLMRWHVEFSKLIVTHTLPLCETGGPSLNLGSSSLLLAATSDVLASDVHICDVDSFGRSNRPALFVAASKSAVPLPPELLSKADEIVPPQSDDELNRSPHRAFWESCDIAEFDCLFSMGALREAYYLDVKESGQKIFNCGVVRSIKKSVTSDRRDGRSRLVMRGTQHRRGIEFTRRSTPTPDWPCILAIVTGATIADEESFSFDMSQFFQSVQCDAPGGPIAINPPRHRRFDSEGRRLVWLCDNWLQGSKGASYGAREELVRVLAEHGIVATLEDPSVFVWRVDPDILRFAVHGDDGIGSSTSLKLVEDLRDIIRSRWPDVKFNFDWNEILGFLCERHRNLHMTIMSAPKHVAALSALVASDVKLTPAVPYRDTIKDIKGCDIPEAGSPEEASLISRRQFMWEATGHLQHMAKIYRSIIPGLTIVNRFVQNPSEDVVAHTRFLIFFAINDPKPLVIGGDPATRLADLSVPPPFPDTHMLDMSQPKPLYPFYVTDGDQRIPRSQNGVIVMFGGIGIVVAAFRQHSQSMQ